MRRALGEVDAPPFAERRVGLLDGRGYLDLGCRLVAVAFAARGRVDDRERHENASLVEKRGRRDGAAPVLD
jgi:hypothetical protein